MISVDEARARIAGALSPVPAEMLPLAEAHGRVLAEDLVAPRAQPPFMASAMDGFAVRADDTAEPPRRLRVVGSARAGRRYEGTVNVGEAVRIFTGAPVPDGADAVLIQENSAPDGEWILAKVATTRGRHLRPAGGDFREGDRPLPQGKRLTVRDLALAAAMNQAWLMVRRRPRIAIVATGDELVLPGKSPGADQIVAGNGFGIAALVQACGGVPVMLGIAADDDAALREATLAARGCDLLVTIGGASVGAHDLVRPVLAGMGLTLDFWRIAMRPGKPLLFGRLGDMAVLGLPGNPASALICGLLFLAPAIAALQGLPVESPPLRPVTTTIEIGANDERQDYLRASLTETADGSLLATPFTNQDSSLITTLAAAECLVLRPPHAPAAPAGSMVKAILLRAGPW